MGVIRWALEPLRELRRRAHADRLASADGGAVAISRWRDACRETVVAGPFEGMRYTARWGDAAAPAKWLGSYEEELHAPVAALIERRPERVVIIGSADGYYTVGMALALPGVRVDAFDPEWLARRNTARLARENGVTQSVRVHGIATIDTLNVVMGASPRHVMVISDCEGAEDQLIDPSLIPALSTSDVVVELHEREDPSLGDRIANRFPEHARAFVASRDRDVRTHAALSTIDPAHRPFIVREFRYAQRWLVLTAPR